MIRNAKLNLIIRKLHNDKIKILIVFSTVLVAIMAWVNYSSANVLPNLPLEEKSAQADTVVIGKIIEVHLADGKNAPYSLLKIDIILKGGNAKIIKIFPRSYIVERSIDCCLVGRRYMFFLKRIKGDDFRVLYGRNGVFLIPVK